MWTTLMCEPLSVSRGDLLKTDGLSKPASLCFNMHWNSDEELHWKYNNEIFAEMTQKRCLYYFQAAPIAFIVNKIDSYIYTKIIISL